jgi:hypothetical protein
MVQIVQICDCIQVLFGWFCCRSMSFVFRGVFGGDLRGGCIEVLGCFLYRHILIGLFCSSSYSYSMVICYWLGLSFCFFL